MMRKEQAGDFPVGVVAVDLEQSERQIRVGRKGVMGIQCKLSGRSFPGW
jgi:hypothetical protein